MSIDLFPSPRRVEWLGGKVSGEATVTTLLDPNCAEQGYRLVVDNQSVRISHCDAAGLRYGHQTLEQLRSDDEIWRVSIEDHPDIAVRGHMLDISRDRVPTRETLKHLVKRLSVCRYNHLQLYTEHTYAYSEHRVVWAEASPMTASDMVWLDGLCAQHGIELAANQNTFGHMERWLSHDKYRDMAETPDGSDRHGRHSPPAALAPTQGNADFALDLIAELSANLASRWVNIGCDEVLELGEGFAARAVAESSREDVFVEHLTRIAMPLLDNGAEVQFWADMVERSPNGAHQLAEAGAVATLWGYSSPSETDGFESRLDSFAASGFRTWLAPGTSGWNSFGGRHSNARANIADAVRAANTSDVEGVLVTEWGDNGHIQPPFAALPALAYAGGAMWCEATNADVEDELLASSIGRRVLDDSSSDLASVLIALGGVVDDLGLQQLNGSMAFHSWVMGDQIGEMHAPSPDRVSAVLTRIESIGERLTGLSCDADDGDLLVEEAAMSAAMIAHGTRRLADRFGQLNNRSLLLDEARSIQGRHRRNWMLRSRPGGLHDSVARLSLPPR